MNSDNDGFSYFYGISMPTANGNILKNTVTGRAETVEDWYGKKYLKKHNGMI